MFFIKTSLYIVFFPLASEVGQCVAVLEDSVNILLSCLESADSKMVSMAGFFVDQKTFFYHTQCKFINERMGSFVK